MLDIEKQNSQVLVCYKSTKCTIYLHFLSLKHFDLLPLVILCEEESLSKKL